MKKYYRLLATFISLASFSVFLFLFGYLLTSTENFSKTSENQPSSYTYFFLKLTTKPQELLAQLKNGKEDLLKKQESEKSTEKVIVPVINPLKNEQLSESADAKEKRDSTNYMLEEKWIQQVIQMNGCFDIYNDFIEKEWMKDHNFIIL